MKKRLGWIVIWNENGRSSPCRVYHGRLCRTEGEDVGAFNDQRGNDNEGATVFRSPREAQAAILRTYHHKHISRDVKPDFTLLRVYTL